MSFNEHSSPNFSYAYREKLAKKTLDLPKKLRAALLAEAKNTTFSMLYWSNAEEYVSNNQRASEMFEANTRALPANSTAIILRASWKPSDRRPLPNTVAKDDDMRQILYQWHYNIQSLADWKKKCALSDVYCRNQWHWDDDMQRKNGPGLSTIGI